MTLYNFAVEVKDDEDVIDYMHKLLGGLIYAVANSKHLALNFYPILGELGNISTRLSKICKWSPTLFKIMQDNCKPSTNRFSNEEEIQNWCRTITDTDMGNNVRLFVQPFVPVPAEIFEQGAFVKER